MLAPLGAAHARLLSGPAGPEDLAAHLHRLGPAPPLDGESVTTMVEAAATYGWLDRESVILETVTSIRRAGADFVLTYWATELARLLRSKA